MVLVDNCGSERLRIDSSGNVSIHSGAYGGGGTAPQLYVRGTGGRQLKIHNSNACLLYTSPSPRDVEESRMPSSA